MNKGRDARINNTAPAVKNVQIEHLKQIPSGKSK